MGCGCAEARIQDVDRTGKVIGIRPLRMPAGHSCRYVVARNALIPEAEKLARREQVGSGWSAAFARHMDALVANAFADGRI